MAHDFLYIKPHEPKLAIFSRGKAEKYVSSPVCTHNTMHMFLTFYRNTLVSLGVHWFGFISSVGICPTSCSNQLPKLGDHERLYSENNS